MFQEHFGIRLPNSSKQKCEKGIDQNEDIDTYNELTHKLPYQTSDNFHTSELDRVLSINMEAKMTTPTLIN